jgi:DNA-binding response OmpR family regulator
MSARSEFKGIGFLESANHAKVARVSNHEEHEEHEEHEATRVGSLEQRSSLARKLMPHIHPPGACIAVLAASDDDWHRIHASLVDELTSIIRLQSPVDLNRRIGGPDVVIIERAMLHDGDVTLRRIRQRRLTTTLIVTGAFDLDDVEHLLDAGADDAIPDGSPILPARLRAAARRARAVNASMRVAVGDIMYDRESRRVWCAGSEVQLTRTEESLLDCLFWYMPRAVTIAELTAFVWGGEVTAERRNLLHVYVGYLRRKLGSSRQMVIRTVRGTGYELAARTEGATQP